MVQLGRVAPEGEESATTSSGGSSRRVVGGQKPIVN